MNASRPYRALLLTAAASICLLSLTACGHGQDDASNRADNSTGDNTAHTNQPDFVDAQTIGQQIVGQTVSGKMSSGSDYGEYYADDGRILAASYTGHWQIQDNRFCLDYGQGTTCYGVTLDGMDVTWYTNGKSVGHGTIQPGNTHDFTGKKAGASDS